MARGWESKNVEEQKSQASATASAKQASHEERQREAERKRRVRELELQRERVLSERTSSPHRRSALSAALADIEEKLAELGWSIHM